MNSAALHRGSTDIARIIEQHSALADVIEAGNVDGFATALVAHLSGVHQLELKGL
jgi:DNA-binding FadR family transcriptional regulator